MIIHRDIIQGSPEWFAIKDGKMSASHATAIGNAGKGLNTYAVEIVELMITGNQKQIFSKDIDRGNELEPIAREVYRMETGSFVEQVGFITYNDYVGCSPDALVNLDGGLELKARNDRIHFNLLLNGKIDSSAEWQMQMCMLVSGRNWWDFGSYNPNFKRSLFIKRVVPDKTKFDKLENGFEVGEKLIRELLKNESVKFELK